jgi:hypothetical protein
VGAVRLGGGFVMLLLFVLASTVIMLRRERTLARTGNGIE